MPKNNTTKSTGKAKVKVNKLKAEKEKVEELTDKERKRIKGGQTSNTSSKKPGSFIM